MILSVIAVGWLFLAAVNFARGRLAGGIVYTGCAVVVGFIVLRVWRSRLGGPGG